MQRPGGLGIWCSTNSLDPGAVADLAQAVERRGYAALWYPESLSWESVALGAFMLSHTDRLVIASGIANIYARDAVTSAQAHDSLNGLWADRFILGLGVSHVPLVSGARGHVYGSPVATMRSYLSALEAAPLDATIRRTHRMVMLAALGPRMLALARDRTRGALPYCVTPEHTAQARAILGSGPWLCVEQKVCLTIDADVARGVARQQMARYLALPNYRNNWLRLGFAEQELADGGSRRFLDAMVVWGDETRIRDVIEAHRSAGADQVVLQAFPADGTAGADMRALDAFAPAG